MGAYIKTNRVAGAGVILALLACLGVPGGGIARAEESLDKAPGVERRADHILREMSAYLGSATEFTFHAEITYDAVVDDTQMIQYGGRSDIAVKRPDRLRAEYRGDERLSSVVFDGSTATIHDLQTNTYSVTEVPAGLDAAVDYVFDKYGFTVPIADFVYTDPYQALIGYVDSGFWVGEHPVDGTMCHHLAFSQKTIDWQIWIEAGPRPVPRKLVITYKEEPGAPQYSVRLTKWDLEPNLSDSHYDFEPPAGADEIDFLPILIEQSFEETEAE